jgi:hypothetical protein
MGGLGVMTSTDFGGSELSAPGRLLRLNPLYRKRCECDNHNERLIDIGF